MNNMQMEVVLHKENNTYVCTYVIYGMYSIPCQPMQYKRLHSYIIDIHAFYNPPRLIQRLLTML